MITEPAWMIQFWLAMGLYDTTNSPAPAYTFPAVSTAGQPEIPPSPSTDHIKAPDVWFSAYKPPPWELSEHISQPATKHIPQLSTKDTAEGCYQLQRRQCPSDRLRVERGEGTRDTVGACAVVVALALAPPRAAHHVDCSTTHRQGPTRTPMFHLGSRQGT